VDLYGSCYWLFYLLIKNLFNSYYTHKRKLILSEGCIQLTALVLLLLGLEADSSTFPAVNSTYFQVFLYTWDMFVHLLNNVVSSGTTLVPGIKCWLKWKTCLVCLEFSWLLLFLLFSFSFFLFSSPSQSLFIFQLIP
jgi:hypothetical protein